MRTRSKVKKAENAPTFPIKKCSYCEEITHLTFDPVKIPKLFNNWSCPKCGVTNQMIWENQNDRNSYEMISNIMISYQITASVAVQQTRYEVFKLPLPSLEEGNADIVTMACEVLNILDIQKKGRKKIIFS